jgi:serine phosphatase RsbU (regulator of sigma subunit)
VNDKGLEEGRDEGHSDRVFDAGYTAGRAVQEVDRQLTSVDERTFTLWGRTSASMVAASHLSGPDALSEVVRLVSERAGLRDARLYLTDLEQQVLRRLDPTQHDIDDIDIDGTEAGLCYQLEQLREQHIGGAIRLWLPLLDGVERLGVMSAEVDDATPEIRWIAEQLSALVAEIVVSKNQFGDSIHLARRRQPLTLSSELRWSLLPPLSSTGTHAVVAANMAPAYTVAGDAFDYAWQRNTLHVALFDAVGHDLHSTRVANLALASYRHSRRHGLDLSDSYRALGEHLRLLYPRSEFVTGQLAQLDVESGHFEWLSAGHPAPLLIRGDEQIRELESPVSPPFGFGTDCAGTSTTTLHPGDHVLFFSDGVTEAHLDNGDRLGTAGLVEIIERVMAEQLPPSEYVRRIALIVDREADLRDDATLLMVAWTGGPDHLDRLPRVNK